MLQEDKQSALTRYRDLIFAAADYWRDHQPFKLKNELYDPAARICEQTKQKAMRDYKAGKLHRLEQQFEETCRHVYSTTEDLMHYLKERTGYDVDLYESVRKKEAAIFLQNEVRNDKEQMDALLLIEFYKDKDEDEAKQKVDLLHKFVHSYSANFTKYISAEQAIPDTAHAAVWSPDHLKQVRIFERVDSEQSYTNLDINFFRPETGHPAGGCSICTLEGVNLGIKVYWKDDQSVVIDINREIDMNTAWTELTFRETVIKIEYLQRRLQ